MAITGNPRKFVDLVLQKRKEIQVIHEESQKDQQVTREKIADVRIKYDDKIRELERARDSATHELSVTLDANEKKRGEQIDHLSAPLHLGQTVLAFLNLDTKVDLTIDDEAVKTYNGRYKENLGELHADDCLKIKLYVVENRKPKNKYSLIALGRSIFHEDLVKFPRSYGGEVYVGGSGWLSLEQTLREAPTVEELKTWLSANRQKQLDALLTNYNAVKTQYNYAKHHYKVADFMPLLRYLCEKCGYFYTIFDYLSYQFKSQCSRCKAQMTEISPDV